MIDKRQHAYLEAMNIPVWVARHQPEVTLTPVAEQLVAEKIKPQTTSQVTPQAASHVTTQTAPQTTAQVTTQTTSQGLKLGPGSDGILLVCARDSDAASKLANDVARVLPKTPVWGWPDSGDSAIAPFEAVNENLFTCVAVFGEALGQSVFGKQVPAALGSATVVILPAMSELQSSADARRKLWSELCRSGMIVA